MPAAVPAPDLSALLPIFNALPGSYLLLSPDLLIEAVSDEYLAATLTGRADLLGRHLFDAFPDNPAAPDARATHNLRASLAQALATGQPHEMAPQHYDVPDPARPGQFVERHWLPRNAPVLDAQGRVEHLIHAVVNVTAQVQAAARLRESQAREQAAHAKTGAQGRIEGLLSFSYDDVSEQVRARQQRDAQQRQLRGLFEQAPVAICVFRGPHYVLDVVNPSMGELWDRRPADVVGRPFFEALPELEGQGLRELLDEVRQTGVPFSAQAQPVRLARHRPGETGYYNFVYQPLYDEQGQFAAIACVYTDVSEQVRARQLLSVSNQELTATNTRLTRANVDLDNFIYTASHDLRAPITNIEGLLLALQTELPPARQPGDVPQILALMLGAVERFKTTITHLSEVVKLQKEHDQPATDVALAAVVADVRLDLAPLIAQTGARLEVALPDGANVSFSAKNLRSVVYNLLSNALKYRHPDRPPVVRLRGRALADYVVLEVQDNGLGLEADQQPELFTMFRRLHSHVEGTGLGLYMVKKMVENAGGRVEVSSEVGVGSTFAVHFRR